MTSSTHAGSYKRSKNVADNIGSFLEKAGQYGEDLFANPMVQRGIGKVGKVIGKVALPIPFIGGKLGEMAGKQIANNLSYAHGLTGEIGGMIKGEKDIGDVLKYVPVRMWEDFKDSTINHPLVQVIRGDLNWRDAIVNKLEDEAMVDFLAPGKTHAWKDKDGNYHKQYVDGAKMVVGEWKEPTPQVRPTINSNEGIKIGPNGEVIRKGW